MSERPNLGFVVDRWLGSNVEQLVVGGCEVDSPAECSGIMAGDCVTTIDGKPPLEFLRSEWWPRSDDTPIRLKLRQRKMGEPVSACALNDPIFDRSDGLLFEIVKYVGAIGDEVR